MKTGIHPDYQTVSVTCSCGTTFETRSTATELKVELCSQCHPFYTGKQKLVDTGGRIDRFERRYGRRKNAPAPEDEGDNADENAEAAAEAPVAEAPAAEAADAAPDSEAAAEAPAAEATDSES